ncbi:transmembrane protein adipocyte-associated 1 homolog [Cydia fagiglandana]|uniref:transmembrane protein adipocyte-associated 1 homolog n=1 Tax=Cydia fagiglandana TaxID=1458189 RepID=UPI002FEE3E08
MWHFDVMNGSDLPPVSEDTFCKHILNSRINNSRVRIWDLIILIPNALFVLFLVVRFNKAQLKLRATSSPIFLTFYSLVWGNVIISVVRCAVAMTLNAPMPLGGQVDKVLWVMVKFFLLATEMSVVIFGLAFGHMDSRSSIRYVLMATSFISLAFTITQGTLEFMKTDDDTLIAGDTDLFEHGGVLFWFTSSLVFAFIYFLILILPWTPLREYLALPTKLSFYLYILLLALLDATQAAGAGMLLWGPIPSGLCVVDVTTWLYYSLYTPLVYHTFLSEFFRYLYILLAPLDATQAASAGMLLWGPIPSGLCVVDVTTWLYYSLYMPLFYHTFLSEFFRYLYILLALLDATQAAGAGMLLWGPIPSGLCVVDVTTWLYYSLYTPLVYHTFLSEFFRYLYILLALPDATQAAGAGMLLWGPIPSGLCVVDVTTWLYYSLYTPLVYHTFLSEFFSVSQPSIMFSYKAQMDEPLDDDQVSLPHQQSFSSLKTDSDYIYQQSNSVYDSTLFEAGGATPMNPAYSASLQSPDSIASAHST